MLIKVFSVLSMLQKLSRGVLEEEEEGGATGLLNKGGGSNRLPGLVTEQLWNFHRYWLVCKTDILIVYIDCC